MGNRHIAREKVLGFLYQIDSDVESVTRDPQKYIQHFGLPEPSKDFFLKVVEGVQGDQSSLDEDLSATAENWRLSRMNRIDRCILRMATWELIHEKETPHNVIIDEALELAKRFGTSDSASFVNGILDQLSKKYRQ